MMKRFLVPFFIVAHIVAAQTRAPSPLKKLTQLVHDQWQVKEGLPQNSVNAIIQTHDGYLWLGTYEGLVRFNGKSFTVFDRGNTPAFVSNRITSLCEDRKGRLWIGTYGGGITLYDGNTFHTVDNNVIGKYINVGSMTIDPSGKIWVITEKGVLELNDTTIEASYRDVRVDNLNPLGLNIDRQGRVWLGWAGPFYIVENGLVKKIKLPGYQGTIGFPALCREGGVWLIAVRPHSGVYLGKYTNHYTSLKRIPDSIAAMSPTPLFEDSNGALWCSGSSSLLRYYDGVWDAYGKKDGVRIDGISAITEDREGDVWVGTNGDGLHRFRDALFTPIGIPEGLRKENVWAIFEDSRRTKWVGSLEGYCYTIDSSGTIKTQTEIGGNSFCFLEDREKNIWTGGGAIVDRHGKRITLDRSFVTNSLAMDSTGRIWLAAVTGGISVVEHGKIVDSISLGNALANISIRAMRADRDGSMWIGTQAGLFHYRLGQLTHYTTSDGLPNNWIRTIYQDSSGTLWIGTDGGLAEKANDHFFSYTEKDGLQSNTIHIVLEDDSSRLWMSSNKGIFVVHKKDLQSFDSHTIDHIPCIVYGEDDGMRSAEGNGSFQQGGWKMDDGTLWFATIKGIAIVNPNRPMINTTAPPVVIEEVNVDGVTLPVQKALEFHQPVNDITFHFAALSYRIPSRIHYRYELDGLRSEWIDAGSQDNVTFSNLSPGDYTFNVIASNDDNVWNAAGAAVSFVQPPYFWQTWWFYGIVGFSVLGIFAGIVRYYDFRKVKRRMEALERQHSLDRERARISQDMHDEVGSTLTRIAILGELAQRSLDRREETATQLQKISDMSRQVIDNLGEIVWALNPKNDTLDSLVAYTRQYAAEYLEITPLRTVLEFSDDIPQSPISAETRRNIFLTVKEAIHNIVKHAAATEVSIHCITDRETLRVTIKDNGKGFVIDSAGRFGNGLAGMRKRIEDIGGHFDILSTCGRGTTVSFKLKIARGQE
ncbi:MAG TPA: two-component regulator propeller domain-containing protein [Bacteroidota bacterium]|nr:two-component regulator propeller domain-containing protein [Bacteroidota bacterium]